MRSPWTRPGPSGTRLGAAISRRGMLGDVTILSGDVTAATPDEIRAMSVIATIVNGVVESCPDPDCPPIED